MTLNRCAYYFGLTIAILTFPISIPLAILCCSDKDAVAAHEPSAPPSEAGTSCDNPVAPMPLPFAPPNYYNPVIVASIKPTEVGDDEPTDVRE
jgi:hypothetical protein